MGTGSHQRTSWQIGCPDIVRETLSLIWPLIYFFYIMWDLPSKIESFRELWWTYKETEHFMQPYLWRIPIMVFKYKMEAQENREVTLVARHIK